MAEAGGSSHSRTAGLAGPPLLVVEHATKSFGSVRALEDGSIELFPGEAHALIGENGAGKSTLVKVLAGVYQPDSGRLLLDGEQLRLANPADARKAGIAVIYQEPTLFPDLSVAENIFMGRQPLSRGRRIDGGELRRQVQALMERLGVPLDPNRPARGLSIADQQIVEIAKALSFEARVIVMDEPTAALSGAEVERLFAVARTLQEHGVAVLFISHRLDEVFALCRRVTVMRDGRHVFSGPLKGLTNGDLVRRMVGRELDALFPKQPTKRGRVALSVRRLTREGVFFDVSFDVHHGEIVGLAGLVGAGRSEVARAVFGIDHRDAGQVTVEGRELAAASPTAAMAAGMGFVPEDRREQGLIMDLSIARNASLASLGQLKRGLLIRGADEQRLAADWAARLRLKFARFGDPVSVLSGGNQQKVVLAKWLARRPTVLIVDEPTRGIDVGTKAEVHRLLSDLAGQGVAVLMISSELPEILGMADRVLVMHEGRLTVELSRSEATEQTVMLAATGQRSHAVGS
ncbi:MAG TPA: sugar ABC transporter ATP-binding protein [Actinomycetota bacterium]|nr:sugar ABC transporter ATP-binding protein [Actinomycetota bacterium]